MISKANLFRWWVKSMEIEISSACNRRCDYCPQSILSRKQTFLPFEVFDKIINELVSLNWSGNIAFHQYNEPLLALDHFYTCLSLVKKKLKTSPTILFTNGDLLTRQILEKCSSMGLSKITLTCQVDPGSTFDAEKIFGRMFLKSLHLGIPIKKIHQTENALYIFSEYEKINILVQGRNFKESGSTRINSVSTVETKRTEMERDRNICAQLLNYMHISYNGNVYICCDCCEGTKECTPYIVGNIKEDSLENVFYRKTKFIQQYLFGNMPACCLSCNGYH